jgi:hypothetical protein
MPKEKLQIILMGWEWDRIFYGIKKYAPNKVIFIVSDPKDKRSEITIKIAQEMINKIKDLIEFECLTVNYYDFDECSNLLMKILEKYKDDYEITINISSGTKILIAATILISQYYPVKLFYVIPEKYNLPKGKKTLTSGAIGSVELPTFRLRDVAIPLKMEKEILLLLEGKPISLSLLIEKYSYLKKIKLDLYKSRSLKSLFSYHLKKLKNKGLVELETSKRQRFIKLTKTGELLKKIISSS